MTRTLKEIQQEIYNYYQALLDYPDNGDLEHLKELLEEEKEAFSQENWQDKPKTNQEFYWSTYILILPNSDDSLFWSRNLAMTFTGEYIVKYILKEQKEKIYQLAQDLNTDVKSAIKVFLSGQENMGNYFKEFMIQVMYRLNALLGRTVDEEEIESIKTLLTEILFMYPDCFQELLLNSGFQIANISYEYQTVANMEVPKDNGAVIASFNDYPTQAGLNNLNYLLSTWYNLVQGPLKNAYKEIIKVALNMLDEQTLKTFYSQAKRKVRDSVFALIDEIFKEMQDIPKFRLEV